MTSSNPITHGSSVALPAPEPSPLSLAISAERRKVARALARCHELRGTADRLDATAEVLLADIAAAYAALEVARA